MDARAVLAQLRRGEQPGPDALRWFAGGLASGEVTDAQAGAFAMGVCRMSLNAEARVALTLAMRDSGRVLDWDLRGPVVDKHSTGGIGDAVSLLLAPALAACGAYVPMISGRGLGHTGGTLDKLESIPGLDTDVPVERLRDIVAQCGCAIVAASGELAPADRRLYAVRDVTGTVESLDLITASILSKKLAAGLEALVLDVKAGSGAFMKTREEARALAQALVATANGAGCRTQALITDMSQPLIPSAGNALEVEVVMETFDSPSAHPRLAQLTCDLGGAALALAGLAKDAAEGGGMIAQALHSGRAAERFGAMLSALGAPRDFVERWRDRLPAAPVQHVVEATDTGIITAIEGEVLGLAVVALGGGRRVGGERINHSVGLAQMLPIGTSVMEGDPLAVVHAASEADAEAVADAVRLAFTIGAAADPEPLVLERIG